MVLLRVFLTAGIVAAAAIVVGAMRPDLPVLGALAAALQPAHPPAAPAAIPEPDGPVEAAAAAEPAAAPEAAAATRAEEAPALYRFLDENGALRIVDSLDQVPPAYRAKARRFETTPDRSAFDTTVSPTGPPAPPRRRRVVVEEPPRPRYDEVVLYKTSWCPACKSAEADLEARGVDFEMRDIEDDDDARAELREKVGMTSVPVLDVDGRLIHGYSPGTYQRVFGTR